MLPILSLDVVGVEDFRDCMEKSS